jgi:hypothetical protein
LTNAKRAVKASMSGDQKSALKDHHVCTNPLRVHLLVDVSRHFARIYERMPHAGLAMAVRVLPSRLHEDVKPERKSPSTHRKTR